MTLLGLLTGGTAVGPLDTAIPASKLSILLPHVGQFISLHGTPAGCVTIVPQIGQMHVSTRLVAAVVWPPTRAESYAPIGGRVSGCSL